MSPRTARARTLRQTATLPERHLWEALRRGTLGAKFRRQHPLGRYVADFACLPAKLVIELEGPVHDDRVLEDERRTAEIEAAGWLVLRFPNRRVMDDLHGVLNEIRQALRPTAPASDRPNL